MSIKYFYVDDGSGAIMQYGEGNPKLRKVEDTPENFAFENAKLTVRIANTNLQIDPKNQYYQSELECVRECLEDEKLRAKGARVYYVVDTDKDINDPTTNSLDITRSRSAAKVRVALYKQKFGCDNLVIEREVCDF